MCRNISYVIITDVYCDWPQTLSKRSSPQMLILLILRTIYYLFSSNVSIKKSITDLLSVSGLFRRSRRPIQYTHNIRDDGLDCQMRSRSML